jgi:hypothetical protein
MEPPCDFQMVSRSLIRTIQRSGFFLANRPRVSHHSRCTLKTGYRGADHWDGPPSPGHSDPYPHTRHFHVCFAMERSMTRGRRPSNQYRSPARAVWSVRQFEFDQRIRLVRHVVGHEQECSVDQRWGTEA